MCEEMMKKRVLIQMRDLRVGNGVATCIMNYYEYTVKHGYEIDFLLNRNIESSFVETVRINGSKIYVLPYDTGKPNIANWKYIKNIVLNQYDIIHTNLSGLNALMCLEAAKKADIPVRIYHTHIPKDTYSIKARLRFMVYGIPCVYLANKYVACSHHAGDSVFGNRKYSILRNAMDTKKFCFNEQEREIIRKQLGIENKFVMGVVGRFSEEKNPFFVIDIFKELKKLNPECVLIWAGEGDLKDKVVKYAISKNVDEDIKFLGARADIGKIYSAMDVFVLPSKFEGLGLVYIEAQISGLECFGSDLVPVDTEISNRMHRLSLKKSSKEWAKEIWQCHYERRSGQEDAISSGYEISMVNNNLVSLYQGKI